MSTRHRVDSSSETTPLLTGQNEPVKRTPLPLQQLAILACIRVAEPISFTLIFPFVNQMMEDLHVTPKRSEIGFYSGLVDSAFAFVQFFTIFHWGRLIAGGLSGNIAVIQSILGEITDKTNEAQAMPLTSIMWSLGSIIGPLIGGSLAHPAEQWPNTIFGRYQFFKQYPYFLPCAVASSITFSALTFGYFRLNETLPSKIKIDGPLTETSTPPTMKPINRSIQALSEHRSRHQSSCSSSSSVTLVSQQLEENDPAKLQSAQTSQTGNTSSAWEILLHRPLRRTLTSGFLLSILATAYDVVFTLLCYTPIHLGGLSLQPVHIGWALALGGAFSVLMLPFGFPVMQRWLGTSRMYRFLMTLWPIVYLALPCLNIVARIYQDTSAPDGVERLTFTGNLILGVGVATVTIMSRVACMTFSLNMMLVKFSAPNKDSLGSTYGVSQTVACVARAISPAFVSSLFAVSIERQLLNGNAVWFVMSIVGFCGVYASQRIPDTD